ncbi:MAG: cytidine deaminase [delta proteobacterium ML8_F1]|nr:MAG: cytidine deaminase [delta proteobacterium ML8_F1]
MSDSLENRLLIKALEAMKEAYVPYSKFPVGAAVMTDTGEIFTGCNIESASFGATVCAERTAIFKAVSEGHRHIRKIAVVSEHIDAYPCGICRQVMAEFADNLEIIIGKPGDYRVFALSELLPHAFTARDLEEAAK